MHTSLNQLQIFLLVFVRFGVSTPYDLQTKAGMGVGLTSPALKRLEELNLVESTPGPRNRLRYSLTESGQEALDSALAQFLQVQRSEMADIYDTVPRAMILAWLRSGPNAARAMIDEGIDKLEALSRIREQEAAALSLRQEELLRDVSDEHSADQGAILGITYRLMRLSFSALQYRYQSQALKELVGIIAKLPKEPFRTQAGEGEKPTNPVRRPKAKQKPKN